MTDHEKFMRIAIDEAHRGAAMGEQPFGAVVVLGGQVVVSTPSLKVSTSDTTAHSETLAIGLATKKLGRREIPEAVFYCTCEPCPMCCGAVLNAGIRTMVIGARNRHVKQYAKLAFNFKDYTVERFAVMVGWDLTVIEGVLEDECVALYGGAAVPLTR
ncbi:MAG: nucleoside deaminase [Rhodoplanes sp.]|uniref:nucleoside deaminase n=1 Tax=Rhodoplanes sp. TaxID=1968906 RepID=UPI0017F5F08F|nr:deaminase [Rhodoplanes sp.]NVO12664.1 nucleoside deaminase [Rhodoplanes sp.]